MGLDQFIYFLNENEQAQDKENEDFYYRKHNRLHGWMESLYRSKGGDKEEFNCVNVELTVEDIKRLEKDIESSELPATTGFFFGRDSYNDYKSEYGYYEKDKQFIEAALEALKEGRKVIYSSWW